MIPREAALRAIAAQRGDAIVVPVYTSAFVWETIAPSPLNLPATGAMGQASSHGLGLALGLPDQRVIVLDGDGSLLMNLGTLVTIANVAPANFYHFVCENGTYEANGSHPIPGQGRVNFAEIAHAAGYPHVHEFDALGTLEGALPKLFALRGPVFVTLKITPDTTPNYDYRWMHGQDTRQRFADAVAALPH